MYFAGEYTNLAFKGFMEGALQSGALTAKTIAKALGLS
jgi:monoamine oxidase